MSEVSDRSKHPTVIEEQSNEDSKDSSSDSIAGPSPDNQAPRSHPNDTPSLQDDIYGTPSGRNLSEDSPRSLVQIKIDFSAPYDTPSPTKLTFKNRSSDSSNTEKSSSQTHSDTITHSSPSKLQAPNKSQTSSHSILQLSSFGYSEDTIRELSVESNKEHVQGLLNPKITPSNKKNPHITLPPKSTGQINLLKERKGPNNFNKIADTVLNHGVLKNIGTMTAITQQEEIVIKNCMRTFFRSENTEKLAMKFWFNRWGENVKIGREDKDEMLIDLGRVRVLGEESFKQDFWEGGGKCGVFDWKKLKVIDNLGTKSIIDNFESKLVAPGRDLLDVIPFCPTVAVKRGRKKKR